MKFAVGILGARGHVGAELIPLLARHPSVALAAVASRALAGQPVEGVPGLRYENLDAAAAAARKLDAWILALPNGEAQPWVDAIAAATPDAALIDLSADYRFDDRWAYGLPELHRAKLGGARRVANPGCYATGIQLAVAPFLELLDGVPEAFGVSGYSGAGTTPSPRNDPEQLRDNLMPYSLVGHLHEREASRHLGRPIHFLPHVAPFFRGITLTVAMALDRSLTANEARERAARFFADEPLVTVGSEAPLVRDAAGRHGVQLGGFAVGERRLVAVATLDNLLKGAATQAVQNLNLAFGRPELEGIPVA